jgi:hypothetical protein
MDLGKPLFEVTSIEWFAQVCAAKRIRDDVEKMKKIPEEQNCGFFFLIWWEKEDGLESSLEKLNRLQNKFDLKLNQPNHVDSFPALFANKERKRVILSLNLKATASKTA